MARMIRVVVTAYVDDDCDTPDEQLADALCSEINALTVTVDGIEDIDSDAEVADV